MNVLTRGDLDGLTSTLFLTLVHPVKEIHFAHPKAVQDGDVTVTDEDIVVNLPYVRGCALWFDHHVSEEAKLEKIGPFKGRFAVAPSAARVVYDYYAKPEFERFRDLLEATDRLDSAQLSVQDVKSPSGWILLGYTLDPRTGFGPEFQKYFRWLVEYVKEVPLEKILQHPEVRKRCDRVLKERDEFEALLGKHARQDGTVIVTDFRGLAAEPVGNRFLVYTLFPEANVEVRLFDGKADNTVAAVGASIFNRTLKVNIGTLMSKNGGGGHAGAGTCQFPRAEADAKVAELVAILKANKKK
jgi:hypothetical protein